MQARPSPSPVRHRLTSARAPTDRRPGEPRAARGPARRGGPARPAPHVGRAARGRPDVRRARAEPPRGQDQEGARQGRVPVVAGVRTGAVGAVEGTGMGNRGWDGTVWEGWMRSAAKAKGGAGGPGVEKRIFIDTSPLQLHRTTCVLSDGMGTGETHGVYARRRPE